MLMKIEDRRRNIIIKYDNLSIGEVFEYENQFYIKSNVPKDDTFLAIRLESGMQAYFKNSDKVHLVNMKLTIENYFDKNEE